MVALSSHPGKRAGFTLVELLVVIVIIGILAGLLIPVIAHAIFRAKVAGCQNNLSQLYKIGTVYATSHKGNWPAAQGEALWLTFTRTQPPLLEGKHEHVYSCNVRDELCSPGETHYRGPLTTFGRLKPTDPIGADRPGNHGEAYGGNVVFKDGSISELELGDEWDQVSAKLSP